MKNKNLNKRKILNDKGLTLYTALLTLAIILSACDSTSLTIFTITKLLAILIECVLYKLLPYIPARLK